MLRAELKKKFGSAQDICQGEMKATVVFKGGDVRSPQRPRFHLTVATEAIPSLELHQDEYDAARAPE